MTPEQYIARLGKLMAAGRHQEALDASVKLDAEVHPPLSLEEFERVVGMMEIAATILSLDQAAAQRAVSDDTEAVLRTTRGAH